jgi:hypothetical protein
LASAMANPARNSFRPVSGAGSAGVIAAKGL